MLLSRLFDIFSDPFVGVVSDKFSNTVSYRFWVLVGIPLFVVSLAVLFRPPMGASTSYLFVALLALYVFRTVIDVPHNALASSSSTTDSMRLQLYGYKSVFLVLGILVTGISVAFMNGQIGPALSLISLIAVLSAVPCLTLFWLFSPHPSGRQRAIKFSPWSHLRLASDVKLLLYAFFFNQVGNAFAASLVIIYIRDVLLLEQYSGIFLGVLFLASAISVPIWINASTRYTTSYSWFASVAASIPVFLSVGLLDSGSFIPYMAVCIVAGALFGADAIYPPTLLAKLANTDASVEPSSHGALFAVKSALSKLSLVVPAVVAFPILEHFEARSPDGYTSSVVFFYAFFPVLFKGISLLFIHRLIISTK